MTAPERRADLLIQGGTAMTPNGREGIDIACRDGKIVGLGDLRAWTAAETFDARGLHILPGVIDSQVHFREPGLTHKEDIESGTRGAVLGGVTGVFEMPNTNPLTLTAADLNAKLASAAHSAWCEHAFYMGGSAVNAEHLAELENLPGCSGVKVFMGSSFGDLLADDDGVLERILRSGQRRVAIHAEDEARLKERKEIAQSSGAVRDHPVWRDVESALKATRRIVALGQKTGRLLHILHISSAEEMRFLAGHKQRVTVEALPHHLTLSAPECYERLGTLAAIPTIAEAGLPAYDVPLWHGMIGPAGVSSDIVARLVSESRRTLSLRETAEQLAQDGVAPAREGSPAQFRDRIRSEIEQWRSVVARAGVRIE